MRFHSRRLAVVAVSAGALVVPVTSIAGQAITRQHVRQYERAYHAVVRKFGHRAPGRNIVRWGFDAKHAATDAQVVASLAVLNRMLAPAPAPVAQLQAPAFTVPPGSTVTQSLSSTTSAGSGLASCIVSRESGGNPQAVSGQYTGIAQWSPESWAAGGGTQYAPTPTQASASQQMAVLNSMLAAGQSGQWTPYDHCGS